MIDFLNDIVDKETLNEIIKNNNSAILYDLSCNSNNCLKIISYLEDINVTSINKLLIERIDLFLLDYEEFIKRISKFNIPALVGLINSDITVCDVLLNN